MTHAMIVLASEQLMPNIEGFIGAQDLLGNEVLITHLFIYHTSDKDKSKAPAERFSRLSRELNKSLMVTVDTALPDDKENDMTPDAVCRRIEKWQQDTLGVTHWIINATGGLKTMFAGTLHFVGKQNITVIYRELSGKWFQFFHDTVSGFSTKSLKLAAPQKIYHALKDVGIKRLVELQSGNAVTASAPPENIDILAILDKVKKNSWNWAGAISSLNGGFAFENWFCALVKLFSPDEILLNLKVVHEDKTIMESDVVVLDQGKFYLFDLKLVTRNQASASIAEQINNASKQAQNFGGITANPVLVRPEYSDDPMENLLATQFKVKFWHAGDMVNLVQNIAITLGRHTPKKALKIEQQLLETFKADGAVISNWRDNFTGLQRPAPQDGIIDMLPILDREIKDQELHWAGARFGNYTIYRLSEKYKDPKIQQWITSINQNQSKLATASKVINRCLGITITNTTTQPNITISTDPTKPLISTGNNIKR